MIILSRLVILLLTLLILAVAFDNKNLMSFFIYGIFFINLAYYSAVLFINLKILAMLLSLYIIIFILKKIFKK